MAKRNCSSIQSKINFYENLTNPQQSERISERDPRSVQSKSRLRWKPQENNCGSFVHEQIRILGLDAKDVNSSKHNASKASICVADHEERREKDLQPDLVMPESGKRNDRSEVTYPADFQVKKNVNDTKNNSSNASKCVVDYDEGLTKDLRPDLDLRESGNTNDRYQVSFRGLEPDKVLFQTIEKTCESQLLTPVSITTISIANVENLNQPAPNVKQCDKDCKPDFFRIRLESTASKIIKKEKRTVRTVAMETVIETLENNSFAGVRGDAYSGKTYVLYGAMQIFRKKTTDWNIILITNVDHLRACYNKENILLVIDDILDQNDYMLTHLDDIKSYINKGYWKVIFSYSNESYKKNQSELTKYSMLDGGYVLNISSVYKCTNDEKIKILNSHCNRLGYELPKETSIQCVKLVPTKYFFYYVERYIINKKDMVEGSPIYFFQNPIEEMVRDLEHLKEENLLGFYVIFCCSTLIHNSLDISNQIQMQLKEPAMAISTWLLESNGNTDHYISVQIMKCAVRYIPKAFIQHIKNNQYRIKFNCVVAAVKLILLKEFTSSALYNNDNLFKHALSLCDLTLVRQFVHSDQNVSRLKKHDKLRHLVDKFVSEITHENVQNVGDHPLLSNDDFKSALTSMFSSRSDETYTWDICSKLDKKNRKALIVFAVEHDTPESAVNLTNFILESKKWRKYSRKEGGKVDRLLLVLQQNASALKSAKGFINESFSTHKALIDSVFNNVSRISKWKDWQQREEAIRTVIEVQAMVLSERSTDYRSEIRKEVVELFQKIKLKERINDKKQSLLQLCVICGNTYFLEWAVEQRKVEINRLDCLGQTPLHTAVQEDNVSAVRILIKSGAVIEIKDRDGNSALHLAVHKDKEILNNLIRVNGTDVNVTNKHGKTPLQLARELQKTEHIQVLELADVIYE